MGCFVSIKYRLVMNGCSNFGGLYGKEKQRFFC